MEGESFENFANATKRGDSKGAEFGANHENSRRVKNLPRETQSVVEKHTASAHTGG
jgi:hypothetical protein